MLIKKQIYEKVSIDDWNRLVDELNRLSNFTISKGTKPCIRKHLGGIELVVGGTAGTQSGGLPLGLIAKTVTKGHPVVYNELGGITTEAVEAVKLYTIIPDGTYNPWAANIDYTADTTITYDELYYTVLIAHRSTEAATPQTATHLYKQAEGVEAVIAGTEGDDMTLYMPYLPVGSKVSYKSSSDGYAVIIGTPTRVENEDERYSLFFDERIKRAKAVFA